MPTQAMAQMLQRIADDREPWKVDYDQAMGAWDLDAQMQHRISVFWMLRSADIAWSTKVQGGKVEFDPVVARQIHGAYEEWLASCSGSIRQLDTIGESYHFASSEEFRKIVPIARRLASVDIESVITGMADVAAGRTVRLPPEADDDDRPFPLDPRSDPKAERNRRS